MGSDVAHSITRGKILTGVLLRAGCGDDQAAAEVSVWGQEHWRLVVDHACRHGLAGLVAESSNAIGAEIPDEHGEALRRAAARIGALNLHTEDRFADIARRFAGAGIDLMALKGIVLSRQVYGRCDLRPMSDVDVLVRASDATRACRLLDQMGCKRGESLVREDFFPRFHYEVEYLTSEEHPVRLDVHVRPFRPARYRRTVPDDGLWEGCRRMNLRPDAAVFVPAPERMLLHLCCHAAIHDADRLVWLLDIKRYAKQVADRLDWDAFAQLASRWRVNWPVLQAIDRTEAVFGQAVSVEVRAALSRTPAGWQDKLALWQAPRDVRHPICQVAVDLMVGGGLGGRLAYLSAVLLPQRAHMATVYRRRHAGWLVCAHAWRVVRSIVRVLRRLWITATGAGQPRVCAR